MPSKSTNAVSRCGCDHCVWPLAKPYKAPRDERQASDAGATHIRLAAFGTGLVIATTVRERAERKAADLLKEV
jgi:hypothetical protein